MKYKFKSKVQENAEANEKKTLLKEKKMTEGKKLLKEATFSVATVDDALAVMQECMRMIALKKRSPAIVTDLISSAIVSGTDSIAQEIGSGDVMLFADRLKKRIMMTIRTSIGM